MRWQGRFALGRRERETRVEQKTSLRWGCILKLVGVTSQANLARIPANRARRDRDRFQQSTEPYPYDARSRVEGWTVFHIARWIAAAL